MEEFSARTHSSLGDHIDAYGGLIGSCARRYEDRSVDGGVKTGAIEVLFGEGGA